MHRSGCSYHRWMVVFLLAVASLFSGTATAQIEEIVVTAQKRAEDIQNVPISISAFSGEFIEDAGIRDLQDLGNYTPNLTFSHSSQIANNRIIMRGVGSVGNNAIDPSVAVFIDGVYYPRPASVVGSLNDIQMVEVLRGPQGTLFGRNASMGALNIRTRNPTRDFDGQVRTSVGNFGDYRISGSASDGLTDTTAGRMSFHYSNRDGYGKNTFLSGNSRAEVGGWKEGGVRGKLQFTPNDNLDILLSADYNRVENQGSTIEVKSNTVLTPQYQTILGLVLDPNAVPGVVPPGLLGIGPLPEMSRTYDFRINQDHQDSATDKQWGVSADIKWKVNDFTLRSITSYRDWKNNTFESALRLPGDLLNRVTAYNTNTFSQELQLLSPTGGRFEYVAGLYFYDENYKINQAFDLGPDFCLAASNAAYLLQYSAVFAATGSMAAANTAGLGASGSAFAACNPPLSQLDGAVQSRFSQDVTSFAAYGQVTFNLTDQWHLTGGLRWTRDDKSGDFAQAVNNIALSPLLLDLRISEPQTKLKFKDDRLTWMANLSYDLTNDIMAFLAYSTGYKSGGFNSDGFNSIGLANNTSRVFKSETVDNYEAGIKSRLFDNRMVANLTLYRTQINNFQDRQFDGVNFFVQNAGKLTQQGVELDITARPLDRFTTVLGMSYLDSSFDRFPDATNLPAVVAATQATNRVLLSMGLPPIPVPPLDLKGKRNHFSPKWQLSLLGEWTDTLPGTNLNWFVRGEYQYIGDQNVGAETNQNPQSIQKAYSLINSRIGLRGSGYKWEISAYVKNATDKGYCQTIYNQPIGTTLGLVDPLTGGGMQRCVLGPPRTFGIEAAYHF